MPALFCKEAETWECPHYSAKKRKRRSIRIVLQRNGTSVTVRFALQANWWKETEIQMITSKQRSYLKRMGHDLDPVVYIGKNDLTDNVIKEIDNLLEARELVKVKIQEGSQMQPKQTANEIAEILGAEFVQAIGRRFILYRRSQENPQIELPRK